MGQIFEAIQYLSVAYPAPFGIVVAIICAAITFPLVRFLAKRRDSGGK